MKKRSVLQVWTKKEPKLNKMLELLAARPDIFKKINGLLNTISMKTLKKRAAKYEETVAKLEAKKKAAKKKFAIQLLPKVDAIDDSYEILKTRIKTKYPEIYRQYF